MSLVKWDPMREMEDLFDRYTRAVGWPRGGQDLVKTNDWSPRVDITESDKEFVIKAELPDVDRKDVKVSVDNGVLTIQGERKQEKEEKGKKFHRVERFYGSFTRRFALPDNVNENKIKANCKDGVLTLEIPKTAKAKTTSVAVKVD